MSQRKIIRTDVNLGDFLKSILHVGDITRQFKCGDSRQILGNWNFWPGMSCKLFYSDITVNHYRYKELIIFVIVYFVLHFPQYFVLQILFLEADTEIYSLK